MTVVCKNPECPELDIPKTNTVLEFEVAEIICGSCNGPVEEIAAEDLPEGDAR
jgi:hypothetical protein